ncbi:MAG: low molecular weight protein-tyrosine-phosphatase [Propionicimonas sp.]|uniref:low molecular weight protein-tyrosine-phosphatase n=1 Tax=Propionicimonas sp. TaxID=1955623 RepID=UPI003D0E072A
MSDPVVLFVCWGNICRSPMAKVVADAYAKREDVTGVTFTSAGVSAEESGHGMDPRAIATLQAAGFEPGPFSAHRMTPDEIRSASMVIGMQTIHLRKIREMVPDAHPLYLLSDFNPDAVPGSAIEDPWYGDDSDFTTTLEQIEAAMPELIRRAKELLTP